MKHSVFLERCAIVCGLVGVGWICYIAVFPLDVLLASTVAFLAGRMTRV